MVNGIEELNDNGCDPFQRTNHLECGKSPGGGPAQVLPKSKMGEDMTGE